MNEIQIHAARYDDPAVQKLVAEALAELSARYGDSGDDTPVAVDDFDPPDGGFFVAERDGELIGCAGWRRCRRGGDAELKRMFTPATARRRGVARRLLATIEEAARAAGCRRLILETGDRQPEAIALYAAAGYHRIEDFGYYAGSAGVLSFARNL
ncbi:MAG TPA: GNAT family N-acetyltransferase [Actinoplanes sp.]|nr:GNAT family N-acetyltransferase [Actinoplanes sp.]